MDKLERAFLNGFVKAAIAQTGLPQIPPAGAPNQMGQPAQPQQMPPQMQPQQMPQMGGGGKPNTPFYQLLAQLKQQNPVPQVPNPIGNIHAQPKI